MTMKLTRKDFEHMLENCSIEHLATEMGVELTPDQPEPGVYLDQARGLVAVDADNAAWDFSSGFRPILREYDAGLIDLNRARVIPEAEYQRLVEEADEGADMATEPAFLTYEEAGRIWNESINASIGWNWGGDLARHALRAMNTALRERGRGSTAPDWDDVRDAVAQSRGNGWGLTDEPINQITDDVMNLLTGRSA